MKNRKLLYVGLAIAVVVTGLVVYWVVSSPGTEEPIAQDVETSEEIVPLDPSVTVTVKKSRAKDNTVVVTATGLGGKMVSVAYEVTYDSQGLVKGVNSGSKPIDVSGKDSFDREIYLGTCSRNVCKADAGVKKVTVVLEFTNSSGKKSQFSQEYDI